jgi:hypothetical protein
MSDTLDLARLEKLLAEATPGPWVRCNLANITTKIDKNGCRDGKGNTWPVEYKCYRGPVDDELATSAVNALPHLLSRISELESALRPFAENPTIEEIVKGQVPNDWAEASVERRIEMMGERKRANDAAILTARNVLGEKA